eukprot:CAMPEP_0206439074 /NCGR_PEP_ID=MMETSP0324_2-20121206/12001_1 /ASSEMBLY_ACC=CAM_ASM_000836 /TAXON_ID=2866 /ORGANISM="Crypthecodinium cohnii, Strain Seligo" /LENGTH=65 /DNA_ID=CAMNT_0053906639 /DNA_START=372 /DNA_END=569 /DNA_ORIENTATION=+
MDCAIHQDNGLFHRQIASQEPELGAPVESFVVRNAGESATSARLHQLAAAQGGLTKLLHDGFSKL